MASSGKKSNVYSGGRGSFPFSDRFVSALQKRVLLSCRLLFSIIYSGY